MNKKSYLILGLIFVLSFLFDKILLEIVPKLRFEALTTFVNYFTMIGTGYFVILFITILSIYFKRKDYFFRGGFALLFSLLITAAIRNFFIFRMRPDIALIAETGFSFPSGHSTAVFSVYPFFKENFKKYSSYWLVFAILILMTRLYLGVHHLSDVIGGALVGLIVGGFVIRSKYFKK